MPSAKPPYDPERKGPSRRYSRAGWDELHERVRRELRPFYKDKDATVDPTFGHPADDWASTILEIAETEVSTTNWIWLRLTNEELRAELADISKTLQKAKTSLTMMSPDVENLFDFEVDVRELRDRIDDFIPQIEVARCKVGKLPKARKQQEVQHEAAVKMTVQILRLLKAYDMRASATADKGQRYISDAVKILKIIGNALGLPLDETTWRDIITEARPFVAVDQ